MSEHKLHDKLYGNFILLSVSTSPEEYQVMLVSGWPQILL